MFITKKDYVVDRILELILSGEIKPGTQLNQRELAERLETSITPVREALMQLETEGIIQFTPHRGARVVSISPEGAREICRIRSCLEELALELAFPKITHKDLEDLKSIQDGIEEAMGKWELAAVKQLNQKFHAKIIRIAGSQALTEVLEHVYRKLPWNALPAKYEGVEKIIRDHRTIIEAIEDQNLDRAKETLTKHILDWGEFLSVYLKNSSERDGSGG